MSRAPASPQGGCHPWSLIVLGAALVFLATGFWGVRFPGSRPGAFLVTALCLGVLWRMQQRLGQELAASEARYCQMAEQVTQYAILYLDPEGRVSTWNTGAQAIKGYEADEILGRNFKCFYTQEDQASGKPGAMLLKARTEGCVTEESWRVRKDGSRFWASVTLTPVWDENRQLSGFLKITRDLTERKRAEDQIRYLSSLYATQSQVNQAIVRIRDKDELLRETVRVCVDFGHFDLAWIGIPDPSTRTIRVAAAQGLSLDYLKGLEISQDETVPAGRGPTGIAFREARSLVVQDWSEDPSLQPWKARARSYGLRSSAAFPVFQEGRPMAVLTLYSHLAGFFQPERLQLLEEILGDLGYALDNLTKEQRRIAAEKELQASERRFRTCFESAGIAKSIATPDGHLLQVNQAYCDMLGYEPAELVNANFLDLTHPADLDSTLAFNRSLIAGEGTTFRIQKRYRHKDGHTVWADLSTVLIGGVAEAPGAPPHFISDLVDISDRMRLEDELKALNLDLEKRVMERTRQLESANQELEAFAYGVSHDLRAPLRTLSAFSEILLREGQNLPFETWSDYLQRIRSGALRMNQLIDDLLRLSRIGREELNLASLDLAPVVREVFTQLQEEDPSRSVELRVAEALPAHGDPRLLRVLLDNLVGNAWKFTAKEARAVIEVGRDPGQGKVFFVRDNGVGFPMEHSGKLFSPFQRLHKATEFPGTGIGLALAKRVVGRHGGRIWAESQPGQGTTFFFTLQARVRRPVPVTP